MAYAAAYCVHTLEMSALRGWAVAFLAYTATRTSTEPWIAPAWVATAMGLMGTWASVAGNETAIRLGRQRLVRLAMLGSIACGGLIGWVGPGTYALAVSMVLVYAVLVWLDSSSLTAGAAGSAAPERRGATLAVHSMLGYAGGFVGPLVLGTALDLAGGQSDRAWGLAFLTVSIIVLAGHLAFVWLRPADLAGDRATARTAP
jgi:MFS family permease